MSSLLWYMSSCARVLHQQGRGHFLIGRHAPFATTVTAKANHSRWKQITHGESKSLTARKHITHGKSKSLTARANHAQQKQIHSREKQFAHGKGKSNECHIRTQRSTPIFIVWSVYFYWQFYNLPKNFWFRHAVVNVQCNIDRDQKKPVSTIFIRNLEMISPRSSVRVRFYIKKHTILALTREARVNGKHGVNRCPSVKSNNISIKAQQTDLRYKNIALSWFAFAVSHLLLPWVICFCRRAERICFCRDSCGPP